MSWNKIKLGDILSESKIISESPNPDRRITVRLKVLGVEKRGLENEVEGATKQYIRRAGQFIYGKQNFHKGAFGIIPPELDGFESSSDLPAFDVDKSCLPEYIFYFFKQGNYYLELSKIASGVATQRINTSQLFEMQLFLPDIETQKKIITNIQILENKGAKISSELNNQISLLKRLRQQLLQDAVQGKLVSQNPKDEPASELLKKIKAEKEKLIAEKKLKKEKELAPIKPEEIPFEIPENWVWCRLGVLLSPNRGLSYGVLKPSINDPNGVVFIKSGDIGDFEVNENINTRITHELDNEYKRTKILGGEILITLVGASIGRCSIVPNSLIGANVSRAVGVCNIVHSINKHYFIYQLFSSIQALISKNLLDGSNRPVLNLDTIRNISFPLPPFEEQNRIVQKLDELMQYCNELDASIKQSESQNEKLLQQVLREALRKEPSEL